MRTIRKTFRRVLLIAVSLALIALAITLLHFQGDYPAAALSLTYVNAANVPISQPVSDSANPKGNLAPNDAYTLHFSADTTLDVAPGTQLQIDRYGQFDNSVQVQITLTKGQVSGHVGAQSNSRAYFRVITPAGVTLQARQTDFVMVVTHQRLLIGTRHGSPTVSFNGQSYTLMPGNGLSLSTSTIISPLPKQMAWATVRVPLFGPDGGALHVPITLTRSDGQNVGTTTDSVVFYGYAGDTLLIPNGTYIPTIQSDTAASFALPAVTVPAGQLSEWPTTLSELQFGVVDNNNNPVTGAKLLNLNGGTSDNPKSAVLPDTLLVPPNKTLNFNVARLETPDQFQPTGDLILAAGERRSVTLRNDLFGGGSIKVSLTNPDGTSHPTGTVALYTPGTEDVSGSNPTIRFKTDDTPIFVAHGDYVAMVSFPSAYPITRRYPVTVSTNKTTSLAVQLGSLTINYSDSSGRPVAALLYVGSDPDLKRLGQTVDQARNGPYGIALRTGQTLTLPSGDYSFRIDALHSPPAQLVTVVAGQNPPIAVTPQPSSP